MANRFTIKRFDDQHFTRFSVEVASFEPIGEAQDELDAEVSTFINSQRLPHNCTVAPAVGVINGTHSTLLTVYVNRRQIDASLEALAEKVGDIMFT